MLDKNHRQVTLVPLNRRGFLKGAFLIALMVLCWFAQPASAQRQNLFVLNNSSDSLHEKVLRYSATGELLGIFVSGPSLSAPSGNIVFDQKGNLYVPNRGNNTIHRFSSTGRDLGVFASSGLFTPMGVAFDTDGALIVCNYDGSLSRFSDSGTLLWHVSTSLRELIAIALDHDDNIYVSMSNTGPGTGVFRFAPDGSRQTLFATGSDFDPRGMAFDQKDNLYVANAYNNTVSRFARDGTSLGTFVTTGLNYPFGLAFDASGDLYVSNQVGRQIRRFSQTGFDLGTFAIITEQTANPIGLAFSSAPQASITCPVPLVLECTEGGAVATVQVGVTDTSGNPLAVVWTVDGKPSQTNDVLSGGALTSTNLTFTENFGLGEHLISVSAFNGDTNPSTCSMTVQVRDTIPPRIVSVSAKPDLLWPPDHRSVPVTIEVHATDNCGPTISKIVRVTSNESSGHSKRGADWIITGDLSVDLRAERKGEDSGRIYTIFVECLDIAGNSSSGSVIVRVPHDDQAPIRLQHDHIHQARSE